MPALTNDQNLNRTARVVDRNGTRRYVTVAGTQHRYFNYRYNYRSLDDTCWLQRRTVTFDHTASPGPSSTPFYNQYRSEEHTSELQSLMRNSYAVFCLKKKNKHKTKTTSL